MMSDLKTEILDLIRSRDQAHKVIVEKLAELQPQCGHERVIQCHAEHLERDGWRQCLACGLEEEPWPRYGRQRIFNILTSEDVTHVDMLHYSLMQPFRGYRVQWRWCVGAPGEIGHPVLASQAEFGMTSWMCTEHKQQNREYYRGQPQVVRMTAP